MQIPLAPSRWIAALVVGWALAAPGTSAAQANRLILPLFRAGTDHVSVVERNSNADIDRVVAASPRGATTIVLDFGMGTWAGSDGKTFDDTYTGIIKRLVARAQNGGVNVLGYVPTCQGNTSTIGACGTLPHTEAAINGYVDKWFEIAPAINGIYFDQGPNNATHHRFYVTIKNHAKAKRSNVTVMLNNPGWEQQDPGVYELADIVQIFEASCGTFPPGFPQRPASFFNPPGGPQRTYMLLESFNSACTNTTVAAAIQRLKDNGAGSFYLYDGNTTAYDHLAPSWEEQAAVVYGRKVRVSLEGAGTGRVRSTPAGIDCSSGICEAFFPSGQEVRLTAEAGGSSTFRGFSGTCTSSGTTCTFRVNAASSVTAIFDRRTTAAIAVTLSGNGKGSVASNPAGISCTWDGSAHGGTCSASFFTDQQVTLTATANSGSTFVGFAGTCSASTATTCTFTPTTAATYSGAFNASTAPAISDVGAATTPTTARITWKTSVSSDGAVDYGPTTAYGTIVSASSGTQHSADVSGLTAGTAYHYRVRSKAGTGQSEAVSADRVLPLITGIGATVSSTTATITWTTNFSSNHAVDFGTNTSYGSTGTSTAANDTRHSVTLSGLSPSTTYHFRVRSAGGLDSSTSGNSTFTTAAPGETPVVATLVDAFDGLDLTRWMVRTNVPGDFAEAKKGLLALTPTPGNGASRVVVDSANAYSLLESSATVNALEVVAASGGINCKFMFHAPGAAALGEVVGFWYEGGTLYPYYYAGGVQHAPGPGAPYRRDAHAWWRIRHSGSTVYWETSRDRATWTALAQAPQSAITFDIGAGVLGFDVTAWGTGNPAPGQAHFTHLNIAPAATAALTDAFTSIDPAKWFVGLDTLGSSASAAGGTLSLTAEPGNGAGGARTISMRPYALTGSSIVVKVPQTVSSGPNVNQIFRVSPGPFSYDDAIGFWFEGGILYAFQEALGSPTAVATLTYSPTHRWWRLREAAGTVYWDTSADGVAWTERGRMAVEGLSFSTAVVSVFMSTNEWGTGNPTPGAAQFSNLNGP